MAKNKSNTKEENKRLTNLFLDYRDNGNERSFNKLYDELWKYIKTVPQSALIFNDEFGTTFLDLFQDAIIKLVKSKDNYNPKKSAIKTYFFLIFKSILMDYGRKMGDFEFINYEEHFKNSTYIETED